MTRALVAIVFASVTAHAHLDAAQEHDQAPKTIFNGRDLTGWQRQSVTADVDQGVLRIQSSRGWLRTGQILADFVLSFDVRMPEGGKAGVYVRGWPNFNNDSAPNSAHRLRARFPKPKRGEASAWSHWEVECVGKTIRLQVDGQSAYSSDRVTNPQGYVGLWASDGTAEFKSVAIRELSPPIPRIPPGVMTSDTPGIGMPRLLKEVKPAYTFQGLTRKIEGVVMLSAVIELDGSVGETAILRSLDAESGLDKSAQTAASQWRFNPATVDGKPVRMLVTIELAFTLK